VLFVSSGLGASAPDDLLGESRVLEPRRARPDESLRPTRAEVSLGRLRHNFHALSRAAGVPIWSVIKADAYGHGSKAIARTLERAGSAGLCVSLLEEAIELRDAGIRLPILVMGGHYAGAWSELLEHRLTPVLSRPDQLAALAAELRYADRPGLPVHLKVDTGMGRLGVAPADLESVAGRLSNCPELRREGLMTHFAAAESDPESVRAQLAAFDRARAVLARFGVTPERRHAANTAATLAHPEARFDLVRPGIGLYGFCPGVSGPVTLAPVMRVRSEIIALRRLEPGRSVGYGGTWTASRQSVVATIPMGYGDGLSRALSNRGSVLIRGRRAPIVGTISMDMASLDVTAVPGASLGDEVVVIGEQRGPLGEASITAQELAELSGTIAWEVLTAISRRVPRFYREE
jgi:alanine racemase